MSYFSRLLEYIFTPVILLLLKQKFMKVTVLLLKQIFFVLFQTPGDGG